MSWHQGLIAAFDLETTGVDVESDRIVTAAVLTMGVGLGVTEHRWLLDPGIEIPDGTAEIHGVTTDQARAEGTSPAETLPAIVDALTSTLWADATLVIYNAPYDLTLLDRECRRHLGHSLPFDPHPVVDPLVIDKALDRYRKGKRTLTAACDVYKVTLDEAHAAHGDALAAARLAWRLACLFPVELGDLNALHDRQIAWAAEQAHGLADYFRKLAGQQSDPDEREQLLVKADGVSGEWPLRSFSETKAAVA